MRAAYLGFCLSAALVVALVGAAVFGTDGLGRHEQLKSELEHVRAANAALQAENRSLSVERRALRHDAVYIESVIRDDLGFVRPDEVVLQMEARPDAPDVR